MGSILSLVFPLFTLVLQVIREMDCTHPTLTEFGLDAVATLQGGVEAGDGVV